MSYSCSVLSDVVLEAMQALHPRHRSQIFYGLSLDSCIDKIIN